MIYRILIIKNRYKKKLNFKFDWANIKVDEISTDFDLTFQNITNVTFTGVIPDAQNYAKFNVPRYTYHAVVLVYGNDAPGIRVSSCNIPSIYPETQFITLANTKNATIKHELIHSFYFQLARQGIYLQDNLDTYAPSIEKKSLELLKPYWDKICNMIPPTKYKYFKDSEIVGLKPELVQLLDKMRGECGFPFKINSGFRTAEENALLLDSVAGSSHLSGLAVDIMCETSEKRFKMIKSALANGITRMGMSFKGNFVHLDIDKTKPQSVIWGY